jgi:hypothetical protein
LDQRIEEVELRLRGYIDTTLVSDVSSLPSHLMQKINERITQALRKNAALDADQYHALARKLEYFDLRELQDVITARTLWPRFESRSTNKDMVIGKFNQLADLRNGLRHSRTVSEITRKEGEAAILWFDQVLDKNVSQRTECLTDLASAG